jgi:hypothetical protein
VPYARFNCAAVEHGPTRAAVRYCSSQTTMPIAPPPLERKNTEALRGKSSRVSPPSSLASFGAPPNGLR